MPEHNSIDTSDNVEKGDSLADALAATAVIAIVVSTVVFWLSGQ